MIRAAFVAAVVATPLAAQQAFDRTKPPALPRPAELSVPRVHDLNLPNGIKVNVVEHRELPLVHIILSVGGGARLDGDRPGLTTFVANMLDEGAGTRNALQLQSELAYLGAQLNTQADWDRTVVSLKVPVRNLEPALDLMADVLRRPRFESAEVMRQRGLRLTGILQRKDQPNTLANLAFNATLYPAGHPYHNPTGGDSASTAKLDSGMVRAFYDATIRPSRTTIYAVGDIPADQLRAALAKRFGDWRDGANAVVVRRDIPPTTPASRRRIALVDKPNAAQSIIIIGAPGVERKTADYAPLMVMNTILGGLFTSRLNFNLRETKGYTYGAGSRYDFRLAPGPFTASAQVRTNVTDSSLVEFFKELRAIRDSQVTDAELAKAKASLELGIPDELETTSQIAAEMAALGMFGLTLDEKREFARKVRAVTKADVQRVARQYVPEDRVLITIVGDLAKVRAGIDALKLGEATVLEVGQIVR
ncbi:MAG: M16 family metallopeptidase [Gemmatimonadaceae bacterium]